jgi:uncharacterized membrane protein
MIPLAVLSQRLAGARIRPAGARALLARPGAVWALTLGSLGEIVADKTRFVPNRTRPLPLVGRLLAGAAAATAAHAPAAAAPALTAALGALGAIAGSIAGVQLRRAGQRLLRRDWPTAIAEDVVCIAATRALVSRLAMAAAP